MKYWIKNLQEQLGITTVYVTHDQNEALTMSDRIAVMNKGVVEQVGTPRRSTSIPISRFVTDFIGESNILEGEVTMRSTRQHRARRSSTSACVRRATGTCRSGSGSISWCGRRTSGCARVATATENVLPGTSVSQSYQGVADSLRGRRRRAVRSSGGAEHAGSAHPAAAISAVQIGWPVESTAIITD